MKEFIDKLIERLEEEKGQAVASNVIWAYSKAINIINQLAEEYKGKYVGIGAFEQVRWERDIAIEQLHELGYEFGQKIDKVSEMPTGSEDCCEWRKGTSGVFPIKTSCGNSVDVNYGYEFCPYCGKKIKVAPYTEGE